MRVPPALRALSHRDFRLFWVGQSVSVVGSWMQTVGQAWLVLDLTGSPFRLGLVSALKKIDAASQAIPLDANPATAHMFIIKPFSLSGLTSLFSTHPPTELRIQALLELARP